MKNLFLALVLVGSLVFSSSVLAYGGGGFHSSSFSSGGFHSSGSFSSSVSHSSSYGGGFSGSSYHSTGTFIPKSTSSYSGGFKSAVVSTPEPKVTYVPNTTVVAQHDTYIMYHPYAYYWYPFGSNWFLWYWLFARKETPQTTVVNNTTCTPTKDVPCPTTTNTTAK